MIKEHKPEQRTVNSRSNGTAETTGRGQGNRLSYVRKVCRLSETDPPQNKHWSVYHIWTQPFTRNKEKGAKPWEWGQEIILFEY